MPPRKRKSPSQRDSEASGRRRSTRTSSRKKSDYFENDDDSDEIVEPTSRPSKRARKANETKSWGRRKAEEVDSEEDVYKDEEDEEEDGEDDESDGEKGRRTGNSKHKDDGNDDDDDNDAETDEDALPKVTFTPHKQLRGLDGVEYADNRVHPNTMLFLRDLKANNRRPWLKENDAEYRRSLSNWQSFVESLTERLIAEVDDTIPELPARDVIFRIYRDIRFSKDSTPYKPHYSAAWSRTGRKGPYACYYVHCEPGKCFVGGGLWSPDAANVQLLRASIDERSHRWRRLLAGTGTGSGRGDDNSDADAFRREFLSPAKHGDESAAIKAFFRFNAESALKTKPKGFIADHRDIELLKLRNYTARKKIPDSVFTDADGQDKVISLLRALSGFVSHLNRIVRPDPNDANDTDSEDSEDGEGNEDDDAEDEES